MNVADVEVEDIKRIALKPGEVLVVRLAREPSMQQAERIREMLVTVIPNNKIIVVGPDVEFAAVSPETASGL